MYVVGVMRCYSSIASPPHSRYGALLGCEWGKASHSVHGVVGEVYYCGCSSRNILRIWDALK